MEQHDTIAEKLRDARQPAFRDAVEIPTCLGMLGDVRGRSILDLGCGDRFHTRLLKNVGAPEVTGADISGAMIQLTEEEENLHPLGCTCRRHDAVTFETCRRVHLVLASYLLHCARTADELRRLCATCHDALGQEGRMVCLIANVANSREGQVSWKRYGVEKLYPWTRRDGGTIKVRITNSDVSTFAFENCYHSPETYRLAFADAGFVDFHWVGLSLRPAERGNPYWDDYMTRPPDDAFSAPLSRH